MLNTISTPVFRARIKQVINERKGPGSAGRPAIERVWLAAYLLKTVKDNQRWHQGAELIDRLPQAGSWFGEHCDPQGISP